MNSPDAESETTSNAVPANGCCDSPTPRIAHERTVEVVLRNGEGLFLRVRSYCTSCLTVLHPNGIDATVPPEVRDADAADEKRILGFRAAVGQHGTAPALGLPDWLDIGDFVELPIVHRAFLWEDYTRFRTPQDRRDRMRGLVGLNRGRNRRELQTVVPGIPQVHVAIDTINHILDPRFTHRQDVDHLRYWPAVKLTVHNPLEAWLLDISPEYQKTTYLFANAFRVGTAVKNHLVVVNANGWIVTSYVMSSMPALHDRTGTLLHVSYA